MHVLRYYLRVNTPEFLSALFSNVLFSSSNFSPSKLRIGISLPFNTHLKIITLFKLIKLMREMPSLANAFVILLMPTGFSTTTQIFVPVSA